jgi:hypothetical protein
MRLLLCYALVLTSCANAPKHVEEKIKPTTIRSPSGQILCAVHKIPLSTIHGWRTEGIVL